VRTTARVIDGAVLVAAKLHSGRETDLRDVLAVAEEIDLDAVTPHLRRGDDDAPGSSLSVVWRFWRATNSSMDFRSDFGASVVAEETVSALQGICLRRLTTGLRRSGLP